PRPPAAGVPPDGLYGICPCAWTATTNAAETIKNFADQLLTRISGIVSPSEIVRLAVQCFQSASVVRGSARRIDRHYHFVAHLQRVSLDALLPELPRSAPFERPSLHHAFLVRRFNLQE